MSAQSDPSQWIIVNVRNKAGYNRLAVARNIGEGRLEYVCSASGKQSMFSTYRAASRVARRRNEDAGTEAELKAKYAGLPPLPELTLRQALAQATGGSS